MLLLDSSLEVTSSCDKGRNVVVTLRCNPDRGTQGELTVPRYCLSPFLSSCPSLSISLFLFQSCSETAASKEITSKRRDLKEVQARNELQAQFTETLHPLVTDKLVRSLLLLPGS